MTDQPLTVVPYCAGFAVADFSGRRGSYGVAYAGKAGKWFDIMADIGQFGGFESIEAAQQWIKEQEDVPRHTERDDRDRSPISEEVAGAVCDGPF